MPLLVAKCLMQLSLQLTDAAIRGAQRFQLDMGQNLLKEVSDDEYQEWRRLWLTVISFDRYVCRRNFSRNHSYLIVLQ